MPYQDKYTIAFDALKKKGEHRIPFVVLTHFEVDIVKGGHCECKLYYEDLITGEKFIHEGHIRLGQRRVAWNPFTRQGPYWCNSIESVIKKFRVSDAEEKLDKDGI